MTVPEDSSLIPTMPDSSIPVPVRRRTRRSGPRWPRRLRRFLTNRLRIRRVLLVLLVALVVGAVAGLVLVTDAFNRVQASAGNLDRLLQTLQNKPGSEWTLIDFNRLRGSLQDMNTSLIRAQRQTSFLRPVAGLNVDLDATLRTIDSAAALTLAAEDMLRGLEPTLFFLVNGEERSEIAAQAASGSRVVELMRLGQPPIEAAGRLLAEADQSLAGIEPARLMPATVLNLERLRAYRQQLEQVHAVLLTAPELVTALLGLEREQNYLVLSQNNDELRPSGGYISTYGWMTVRNGRVMDYAYFPTTATSPAPPAAEMASQFTIPDWWIQYGEPVYAAWDGSWSPDFPTTASLAMWYYNNGRNPQSPVDGVIAIDIVGFELLLSALGSVPVVDFDIVVTPENFRQYVYTIRASGEGDLPHKRFLATLYQAIFDQWQQASSDATVRQSLLSVLLRALREKHLMLSFADPQLNEAVALLGWAGQQTSARDHDYLMVVDANLGNKSNRSVLRSLAYDIDLQPDGAAVSQLAISYDYGAQTAANDPAVNAQFHGPLDYDNLLQVFAPPGARLLDSAGLTLPPEVVPNADYSQFVAPLTVAFDSTEQFTLRYETFPLVETIQRYNRYRLLIQKQPGALAESVSVQILLPPDASVLSANPPENARYNLDRPVLVYQLALSSDQWIDVIYTR